MTKRGQIFVQGFDRLEFTGKLQYSSTAEEHIVSLAQNLARGQQEEIGDCVYFRNSGPSWSRGFYRHTFVTPLYHVYFNTSPGEWNSSIHLHADCLNQHGVDDSLAKIKHFLRGLEISLTDTKVTRLDYYCDLFAPGGFVPKDESRIKALSSKRQFIKDGNGVLQTLYVGSRGATYLRIYDKTQEILDNDKVEIRNRYPENHGIWRVEYETRRKFLAQFGVDKVERINESAYAVWQYLTTRSVYIQKSKEWSKVQQAFPVGPHLHRKIPKPYEPSIRWYAYKILPYLADIGYITRKTDLADILSTLNKFYEDDMKPTTWENYQFKAEQKHEGRK